jgi:hypothetical protein
MILEHRLETRTRGLVCGPALLVGHTPVPRVASEWSKHWKVVVRAREGGEILWSRPFATEAEALLVYLGLIGPRAHAGLMLPGVWQDGELEYALATVVTFNATNTDNTKDWNNGGNLTTNFTVTPGASNTITIGSGGPGAPSATGGDGANSVFSSNAALKGGGGGRGQGPSNANGNGGSGTYGSGGGGGGESGSVNTSGGAGTPGQGNNGGANSITGVFGAGAGGGASAVGQSAQPTHSGDGGNGTASSISGSSVTYAGGGGGGAGASNPSGPGAAGSGGGGAGGANNVNGSAGTANRGGGGGGSGALAASSGTGGDGGSGVLILSFTANQAILPNSPMLGM